MQIQKQNPGMAALLTKLLPLLGKTAGTAAGGPVGGAIGTATGTGLEALLGPKNQEAQMIGGKGPMQSVSPEESGGHMQQLISSLLSQLKGSQEQKQQMAEQGAPPEAEQQAEEGQKDMISSFMDSLSGEGRDLMMNYLRAMAFGQLNQGK